jgi:REP element-mobilizing transposase RayT
VTTSYEIQGDGMYYLTLQIVGWVDVFTRKIYRDILIESLQYCQQHKGLNLYAYVIISNHVHLLAQSETGDYLYSSASNYAERDSIIDVIKLDFNWKII